MGLEEKGMRWHSFKRFRKTWLRGARCLADLNNFWMAYKPQTMSELCSHLHEELELRLQESERVRRLRSLGKHAREETVERHLSAQALQICAGFPRAHLQTGFQCSAKGSSRLVGFGFVRHAGCPASSRSERFRSSGDA